MLYPALTLLLGVVGITVFNLAFLGWRSAYYIADSLQLNGDHISIQGSIVGNEANSGAQNDNQKVRPFGVFGGSIGNIRSDDGELGICISIKYNDYPSDFIKAMFFDAVEFDRLSSILLKRMKLKFGDPVARLVLTDVLGYPRNVTRWNYFGTLVDLELFDGNDSRGVCVRVHCVK
jgi:hypothetical protein